MTDPMASTNQDSKNWTAFEQNGEWQFYFEWEIVFENSKQIAAFTSN